MQHRNFQSQISIHRQVLLSTSSYMYLVTSISLCRAFKTQSYYSAAVFLCCQICYTVHHEAQSGKHKSLFSQLILHLTLQASIDRCPIWLSVKPSCLHSCNKYLEQEQSEKKCACDSIVMVQRTQEFFSDFKLQSLSRGQPIDQGSRSKKKKASITIIHTFQTINVRGYVNIV